MKRIMLMIGVSLLILFIVGLGSVYLLMEKSVSEKIELVKTKYSGTAEEALIAFLQDEQNTFSDRTHIAVWTLGQIKSEMALPILKSYYKDDPKGETCYGLHDEMICQYELYKAIEAIEGKMLFSYNRLNK